jgi:hypothetical protein
MSCPDANPVTNKDVAHEDSNPFGVRLAVTEWPKAAQLAIELVDAELARADLTQLRTDTPRGHDHRIKGLYDVLTRAARDAELVAATGRWRFEGLHREPTRMLPGDVLGLRAATAPQMAFHRDEEEVLVYGDVVAVIDPKRELVTVPQGVQLANLLYAAESYWLPAHAEETVLNSQPPATGDAVELRLPHGHSVVWFAQALEIPTNLSLLPVELLESWRADSTPEIGEPFCLVALALRGIDPRLPGDPGELVVEGVVLAAADDEGRPHDLVLWVCRVDHADRRQRVLIPGFRSRAGWRTALDVLTAVVAWGDWTPPAERLVVGRTRDELRSLRHGRTRRREEAGGLAMVRVLDARPRAAITRQPGGGTHASPITHLRRGHFRRVPVGPGGRDRDMRWIRPTIVNPGGSSQPARVYRLPPPTRRA